MDTFIDEMPLFKPLSLETRRDVAAKCTAREIAEGTILAMQGKTSVEEIYLIKSGVLQVYLEQEGEQLLSGYLKPGEVFGGISILMNAGIAVRTVRAETDAAIYVLSKDFFLDLCRQQPHFKEYFVNLFTKRMLDETYATVVKKNQAFLFISGIVPFSFLPHEELQQVADALSLIHYPKNKTLCHQGRTAVDYLYVIHKGALERFYEEDGLKTLTDVLSEGDIYGGISMLLNNGKAVRSLRTTEETYLYILPKVHFLEICQRHEAFSEYFTDAFGKRMLNRSYASIITRTNRPADQSLQFFDQPVTNVFTRELVSCPEDTTIQEAARIMSARKCSSIFVTTQKGHYTGIVTDNDLRNKVIAKGSATSLPVSTIMSSPLATIPAQTLVFEALLEMMQQNIKHLAVTDSNDDVIGAVTNHDLLIAQGQSPFFLIRDINTAERKADLMDKHGQLPALIQSFINSGAKARNINRLITTISDAILNRLIAFALEELGPAPARFVFMILGSEGRREQTLKTDQDNAIIFEDIDDRVRLEEVRRYFLRLGETVCGWLDQAGYAFCEGGVMAQNPKWCQPLAKWKEYFHTWIRTAEGEDLLKASIFFDFRGAYGEMAMIEALRRHLLDSLQGWAGFFRHMCENALHFKAPIGFFRNFVVESKGEHRDALDIKGAMQPIVDIARIYALQIGLDETNTLERLRLLYLQNVFTHQEYNELEQAYTFLMQLRFVRQVTAVTKEQKKPDNYIRPKKLSRIEQKMLKEIFSRIENFQKRLDVDFMGMTF